MGAGARLTHRLRWPLLWARCRAGGYKSKSSCEFVSRARPLVTRTAVQSSVDVVGRKCMQSKESHCGTHQEQPPAQAHSCVWAAVPVLRISESCRLGLHMATCTGASLAGSRRKFEATSGHPLLAWAFSRDMDQIGWHRK